MPVAEALACGTPVVSSDRGSLPEIAPELVQHCDPFDVDALCSAVLAAVQQQAGCNEFQVSASKAVERFRKDTVTPGLVQLYAQLAANAV